MPVHDYTIMLWIRSSLLTYNMNDYVAMQHFSSSPFYDVVIWTTQTEYPRKEAFPILFLCTSQTWPAYCTSKIDELPTISTGLLAMWSYTPKAVSSFPLQIRLRFKYHLASARA